MNAAVELLRQSEHPFNTRELVAMATAQGLWTPTGAKTPEQTLYGAIFREIATKEQPRIVKAEQKGKFRRA
ncbi:HTH domain-containing protein [Victivallis vadensis]|uniref:HTH domain-containing protein n=1 Tax=Victivallis vadensis TaxID=172901 RepID=UPI00307F5B2C